MVNKSKGKINILDDKGSRRCVEGGEEKTDLKLLAVVGQLVHWFVVSLFGEIEEEEEEQEEQEQEQEQEQEEQEEQEEEEEEEEKEEEEGEELNCYLN